MNFCVSGFGLIERPRIPELKKSGAPPRPTYRPVYFAGAFRDTPVYDRASLAAGDGIPPPPSPHSPTAGFRGLSSND